ncbi:DMT family transporter [Nocardioides aurantiacus]|uniref:Threonine/homoserine efflux transporter RhtA n=1 Tax=Nocardioides aurantiacus TaxID=86796 RepID=A0A3N2CYJ5_9ACTN|nr:DMT family transporter [Nocardioides aurantiacus]ROR92508.1 threonine/homoserine efflux transporter RhtA [Nocardioides aurantiacus]
MTPTPTVPRWLPLAAVATTLVLWASAFVAIRHLGDDFSPGALSLGRLLVGAVALAAVALPQGRPSPTRPQWVRLVSIGLLWFALYNLTLNAGELLVDAGTASMLVQVAPVLIALLAALFLGERFTTGLGLGLALAFGGVALISVSTSSAGDGGDVTGVLLVLVSAVAYAVSVVLQKPLMGTLSAVHVTWIACTVGAVACLPFAGRLVADLREAPASSIWWLVFLGVFPTAIAFTTYAFALRHMSASSLGVTTYLVPPITVALGLVFLGEAPPTMAYAGGALALLGVAVARRRPRPRTPTPGEPAPVGSRG